tara:strand:+ start:713 stop:1489 length:777 start_codon:yes stop_codon:yes gene_type:complete
MGSNLKTYIFMGIITLISSLLLSYSYSSLKQLTDSNIKFDIKRNIVKSAGYDIKEMSKDEIIQNYSDNIKEIILDPNNQPISDTVWDELIGVEDKKNGLTYFVEKINKIKFNFIEDKDNDTSIRKFLPLFYHNNKKAYIIPISGKGLWSTLFGFIAIGEDGNTVKGITFYKHKETPGLGGEVDKKWFQNNFIGKKIFNNNDLVSIKVAKGALAALPEKDWNHAVDGITGATMTSQGLTDFLIRDLKRYETFLREVNGE